MAAVPSVEERFYATVKTGKLAKLKDFLSTVGALNVQYVRRRARP